MKNKISHKLFPVLISAILFISIMPFNIVKADESVQTYYSLNAGDHIYLGNESGYYYYFYIVSGTDVRLTIQKESNTRANCYLTSTSSFTYKKPSSQDGNFPENQLQYYGTLSSSSFSSGGITYYDGSYSYSRDMVVNNEINTIPYNSGNPRGQALLYSFGNNAVGPTPPEPEIEYGSLKIGFSTSIAYSGGNSNAWRLNKDTIWFDQYDTLGNDLRGLNIELQAVPYSTEASTRQNLLGQKFNEFFYDTVRVGSLGFYSPGQNPIDFTWEYITNRFSPTWWSTYGDNWSLTGWFLNEGWYKVGWAYRARVVDDELNTIIDWQWIYNATSVDAQDTDNIINNTGYNPDLVNSINNINNINNTTNNNYYNNQTINYNDTEPTSDGSWIEEMIRGIFSTIGTLIEMIGGVFSDLIKGLSDMIVELGVDVLGFFSDIFDSITGNNQQIDLTLPEFNLTQNDVGALNEFKKLTNGYVAIFINSGMWFVIVVPLVMMLVKVVIKWKS